MKGVYNPEVTSLRSFATLLKSNGFLLPKGLIKSDHRHDSVLRTLEDILDLRITVNPSDDQDAPKRLRIGEDFSDARILNLDKAGVQKLIEELQLIAQTME